MKLEDSYIEFLGETVKGILKANNKGDITVSVHKEYYYEKKSNVDITVKFLPGQIQNNIPQYPAEMFIEIEEEYRDDVLNALTIFVEAYNEVVSVFNNQSYKQFYTLPNVLSAFQNGATKRIVTASISATFFSFENICGITSITIDNEPVGFVNANMSYVTETNSTGGINSIETKSTCELATRTFTLVFVPKKGTQYSFTSAILNLLFSESPTVDSSFSVTIARQFGTSMTWTTTWTVKELNYGQELNGFPTIQVTFVRRF